MHVKQMCNYQLANVILKGKFQDAMRVCVYIYKKSRFFNT